MAQGPTQSCLSAHTTDTQPDTRKLTETRRGTCDTQRQTTQKPRRKAFCHTCTHTYTQVPIPSNLGVCPDTPVSETGDLQLPNTHQSPHTNPRCHQPAWRTWEAKWRWTVAAEQRPSVDSTRREEPWRPPCPHTRDTHVCAPAPPFLHTHHPSLGLWRMRPLLPDQGLPEDPEVAQESSCLSDPLLMSMKKKRNILSEEWEPPLIIWPTEALE